MVTYFISAKTWRQKKYGNTYYSLRIRGTDGTDIVVPMEYGHGVGQYRWRAAKAVGVDLGGLSHDEKRAMFQVSEEYEVSRKSDLHKLETEAGR
jgi:hypothetical protein